MTERADIPLNTAREPRVSYGEVARLDYRVGKEQLLLIDLVIKGVKSAAVLGQKLRIEVLVFKHEAFELQGDTLS